MKKRVMPLVVLAAALAACNSDNALVAFVDSGCKTGATSALTSELDVRQAPMTTAGAQSGGCFAWDATGDTLKVVCTNFSGGCSVKWQGNAKVGEGNALALSANHEPETDGMCMNARCGSCTYDWTYEVKGIDATKDCPLTLTQGGECIAPADVKTYEVTLPLATTKKGSVCL